MVIDISVAVIALAFVVLVVYLVITLIQVKKSLQNFDRAVNELAPSAKSIAETSDKIAFNMLQKAEMLDPLFDNIANRHNPVYAPPPSKKGLQAEDIIEFGALGLSLYQKFKQGRQK